MFRVKRIYDDAIPEDGVRILVDRVWPRGVSKQQAKIDQWMKDIAPSRELRNWFKHDPDRWSEFKRRYFRELEEERAELARQLIDLARARSVTLLYSAKDVEHNQAQALREYLCAVSKG